MRCNLGEVLTAMVTPMDKNGHVDFDAAEKLATHLADNGSDGIVVCGTTGEAPTLSFTEELELLSSVKRAVNGKAKVIFGAGSNCTETAVKSTINACKEGVDAILSVVPYYNKPSQAGMIEHFSAIAKASEAPVILYNIQSRTGVNMLADTVAKLANNHSNIVALKQSFPDMDAISELKIKCPSDFVIYSGDDSLTLPMLSLGVDGVISVASHLFGKEIKSMIRNFKTGDIVAAKNMHIKLYPIFKKLFFAPNPVPVKAILANNKLIEEFVRRPLVELTDSEKEDLLTVYNSISLEGIC